MENLQTSPVEIAVGALSTMVGIGQGGMERRTVGACVCENDSARTSERVLQQRIEQRIGQSSLGQSAIDLAESRRGAHVGECRR